MLFLQKVEITWIKKKIQDLILKQQKTLADVEYLDLDSVAKVMKKNYTSYYPSRRIKLKRLK